VSTPDAGKPGPSDPSRLPYRASKGTASLPPISSNQVVARSYHRAVEFVKREDDRRLTQREYLDTTFGANPATGKPYNPRTLRKWLTGERRADKPVARAARGGGTFNVSFSDRTGQVYSANVDNTLGSSRLDIYTPKRQADFKRTAKKAVAEKFVTPAGEPQPPPKPGETPKRLRSTRGLKAIGMRPVSHARQTVILNRGRKLS